MIARNGLLTQIEVVEALVLRETRTRFGANQLGYLWALIEPALWSATFYAFYAIAGREAPVGMDLVSFLLTELPPFSLFNTTVTQVSQAINGNKALLFYPQVRTLDIVIARTILETATYASVFAIFVLGHALYVQHWPTVDDVLIAIFGFALAACIGAALGLVFCALEVLTSAAGRVRGPLLRPLFWCSGMFYTANGLPTNVRDVMLYYPLFHAVEIVRDGWVPLVSGAPCQRRLWDCVDALPRRPRPAPRAHRAQKDLRRGSRCRPRSRPTRGWRSAPSPGRPSSGPRRWDNR